MNGKTNVLFICKFNQTRSQFAREIFKKLNKNKNIKADSAGIIKPEHYKDLDRDLKFVFRKHSLKHKKPKQLSKKLLKKQDYIVVMADDVPLLLFNSQKKEGIKIINLSSKDAWKYKDKTRIERFERVYEDIEKKIIKLITRIK